MEDEDKRKDRGSSSSSLSLFFPPPSSSLKTPPQPHLPSRCCLDQEKEDPITAATTTTTNHSQDSHQVRRGAPLPLERKLTFEDAGPPSRSSNRRSVSSASSSRELYQTVKEDHSEQKKKKRRRRTLDVASAAVASVVEQASSKNPKHQQQQQQQEKDSSMYVSPNQPNTNQSMMTQQQSLFGEVMMRSVQKPINPSDGFNNSNNNNMDPPSTPQQLPVKSSLEELSLSTSQHHHHHPSANTKSPAVTAAAASFSTPSTKDETTTAVFSPGGFQMMQYVNQAADSPFQIISQPQAENNKESHQQQQPAKKKSSLPRPEWYPLKLTQPRPTNLIIPLLDWSLKDQAMMEFQDCSSHYKQILSQLLHLNLSIEQQAQQQFCRGASHNNNGTSSTTTATTTNGQDSYMQQQWAESLLYWQYPSTNSLATEKISRSNSTAMFRRNHSLTMSNHTTNNSLFWKNDHVSRSTSVRSRHTTEQLLAWKQHSSSSKFVEWHDAFWSLYGKWRLAVRTLKQQQQQQQQDQRMNDALLEDVTRTCFYACGAGHSVLFRVGIRRGNDHEDNNNNKEQNHNQWSDSEDDESSSEDDEYGGDDTRSSTPWTLTPEIIFSSSSLETRNKLRQMGAQLTFIQGPGGMDSEEPFSDEEAFWQMWEQRTAVPGGNAANMNNLTADSPTIQAELVALRRAQIMGHTVGADITVKMQNTNAGGKRRARRPRPRHLPPLMVSGDVDCASFAELYWNQCGNLCTDSSSFTSSLQQQPQQQPSPASSLPVLVCREKLGPFLHASLKRLRVQRLIRPGTLGFRVQGLILPCAMRSMIRAVADKCTSIPDIKDVNNNDGAEPNTRNNNNNNDDESTTDDSRKPPNNGKLWIRLRSHKGYESAPLAEGTIGNPSSQLFNNNNAGGGGGISLSSSSEHKNTLVCELGDVASDATMEFRHPSVLSVRLEKTQSNTLI